LEEEVFKEEAGEWIYCDRKEGQKRLDSKTKFL